MPQPDNRREQGAVTQTSQQQIAPQGQMAPSISQISGGAAAAAPVLQIGQQAQIRQTGAELYQALAGTLQGVAQGLQNYEKMYNLVSETDYAEFETAYLTEHDRVKGDPAKLKVWMDNQTYKPNRVTSKRFFGLRAQINGKAYEEDQMDLWMEDLSKISQMDTTTGLDYLRQRMELQDPNSPYAKQAERKMIELQGQVATSTRNVNMTGLFLQYQEENVSLVEQLKQNPQFAQSLDNPAFQLVLANRSLGLATVDPASGQVQLSSGETFDLNSITGVELTALQNSIGEYMDTADPQLAMQAYRAANLPAGVLGRNQATGTPAWKSGGELFIRLSGVDPAKSVRDYLLNGMPVGVDNAPNMAKALMGLGAQIAGNENLPAAERTRLLGELRELVSYDNESSTPVWEAYGIESKEEFTALFGPDALESLDQAFTEAAMQSMNDGFSFIQTNAGRATSTAQVRQAFNFGFETQILPQLVEIGNDARVLVYDAETEQITKLTVEEYEKFRKSPDFTPSSIVAGVEIVEPEFSDKVPFMFGMDPTGEGGFVYTGSGNAQATQAMRKTTDNLNKTWDTAKNTEKWISGSGPMLPPNAQDAVAHLFTGVKNPYQALATMARPGLIPGVDVFPSGESGEASFNVYDENFNENKLADLGFQERDLVSLAVNKSLNLENHIRKRYGERAVTATKFAGLVDPNLKGDDFQAEIDRIHGLRGSNEYNLLTTTTKNYTENLLGAISSIEQGIDVDITAALNPAAFAEEPTTTTLWEDAIAARTQTDYLERYGKSIEDDIISGDPARVNRARNHIQEVSAELSKDSLLVGVSGPSRLIEHVKMNPTRTSHMPSNPDDLYAPGEFSITAASQGLLAFMDTISATEGEGEAPDVANVAKAFGLETTMDLVRFRAFLKTGQADTQEQRRRYTTLRKVLESGIEIVPVDRSPGQTTAIIEDKDTGASYQEMEYRIQINEDMIKRSQKLSGSSIEWLIRGLTGTSVQPGMDPTVYETVAGKGKDIIIRRRLYLSRPPQGLQTGNEVYNSDRYPRVKDDMEGIPLTTGQALRP